MKLNSITLETPVDELTFTVFDIETTGVRLESGDQMVEIGLLHYSGRRILDTYSTLIRPSPYLRISREVAEVHNIPYYRLRQAPSLLEIIDTVIEFFRGTVVVAHNVNFDMGFLQTTLERIGRERLDNWSVDTLYLTQKTWPRFDCHCLSCLRSALKMKRVGNHRAMADVYQTTELLQRLIDHLSRHKKPTLADLHPFRRDYTWKGGDIYREMTRVLKHAIRDRASVIIYSYSADDCSYSVEKARPLALLPKDRLLRLEDDTGKVRIIPLFDIVKIRPARPPGRIRREETSRPGKG